MAETEVIDMAQREPTHRHPGETISLQAAMQDLARISYRPVLHQTVCGWTVRLVIQPTFLSSEGQAHTADVEGEGRVIFEDYEFPASEVDRAVSFKTRKEAESINLEQAILFMKVCNRGGDARHVLCELLSRNFQEPEQETESSDEPPVRRRRLNTGPPLNAN